MPTFKGTLDEEFEVQAAPEHVARVFRDLDVVAREFGDLESFDRVDDQTLRYVMENQNHGVFQFQGRYACRYIADGETGVRWETLDEEGTNVRTSGYLSCRPGSEAGTSVMRYVSEMELDIDVSPMLAPVLGPVVGATIPVQVRDFVKRMVKAAEA